MADIQKREQAKEWCVVLQKNDFANNTSLDMVTLVSKLNSLSIPYYSTILHDLFSESEQNEVEHFHLVMQFTKVYDKSTILDMLAVGLGVSENTISIQKCMSIKSQVRYLIHKDNPEKHQFDVSEIFTNNFDKTTEYLTDYEEPTTTMFSDWLASGGSRSDLLKMIGLKNYQSFTATINSLTNTYDLESHIKRLEQVIKGLELENSRLRAELSEKKPDSVITLENY